MTIRLNWVASVRGDATAIAGSAWCDSNSATATAEICFLDPSEYGVPENVDRAMVFRFSRCKSRPRGKGGGSASLKAALDLMDRRGLWAVLEASPYPGQGREALYAFYEKHGFQHNPTQRGLMFRPPRGT